MSSENQTQNNRFSPVRFLILALACGVFLYSGLRLISYFVENRQMEKEQQALIGQAVVMIPKETVPPETAPAQLPEGQETVPPTEVPVETAPIYVDFEALRAQNSDVVGWIYCEGTPINYPIVQCGDNQRYVHRTFEGKRSNHGAIFMDFRNLPDFSDFNTIIYGHNLSTGAMFGSLRKFKDPAYYQEHPVMWILTPDKAYRMDLILGHVTPAESDAYEVFSYIEDLHERLEFALSESTFDAGEIDVSQITRVVSLSTCSKEYSMARYVVIGTLVEVAYPQPPATE